MSANELGSHKANRKNIRYSGTRERFTSDTQGSQHVKTMHLIISQGIIRVEGGGGGGGRNSRGYLGFHFTVLKIMSTQTYLKHP